VKCRSDDDTIPKIGEQQRFQLFRQGESHFDLSQRLLSQSNDYPCFKL
jgi:hypothetical protein